MIIMILIPEEINKIKWFQITRSYKDPRPTPERVSGDVGDTGWGLEPNNEDEELWGDKQSIRYRDIMEGLLLYKSSY